MYMLYDWLSVLCLGLLIEAVSAGTLVSVWFSAGAVVPLIMSFWGIEDPWYITVPIIIFGLVTSLSLIFLRKFAKKLLYKNKKDKTNLDLYVGKKFIVNDLEIGDRVEIIRFQGNKAIVKKV